RAGSPQRTTNLVLAPDQFEIRNQASDLATAKAPIRSVSAVPPPRREARQAGRRIGWYRDHGTGPGWDGSLLHLAIHVILPTRVWLPDQGQPLGGRSIHEAACPGVDSRDDIRLLPLVRNLFAEFQCCRGDSLIPILVMNDVEPDREFSPRGKPGKRFRAADIRVAGDDAS